MGRMGSIKDWVIKKFLIGWLREKLSALPFDGWKTVVGLLLIILGELLKAMPQYAGVFSILIEILKSLPYDAITDFGIISLVAGVVHKLLKYFHKDEPPATPKLVSGK